MLGYDHTALTEDQESLKSLDLNLEEESDQIYEDEETFYGASDVDRSKVKGLRRGRRVHRPRSAAFARSSQKMKQGDASSQPSTSQSGRVEATTRSSLQKSAILILIRTSQSDATHLF